MMPIPRLHVFATAICAALLLFAGLGVPRAGATQSPVKCDQSGPKYHCSWIFYNITGTYNVEDRQWQGAIDDGAKRWRLNYAYDYSWNGYSWEYAGGFGATGWLSNVQLSGSTVWAGGSPISLPGGGVVQMRHGFEECTTYCYPWADPPDYHWLT